MPGCLGPSAKLPRHLFPCAFLKVRSPAPVPERNLGINFQAHHPEGEAAASLYFLLPYTHFAISLPANPKNPSCHACVIMPGRRLFRISARIPNSKPYTRIMMADRQP